MACMIGAVEMDLIVVADTGAAMTVFPRSTLPTLASMGHSFTLLRWANELPLQNSGEVSVTAQFGDGPEAKIEAVISSDLHGPPLIGYREARSGVKIPK